MIETLAAIFSAAIWTTVIAYAGWRVRGIWEAYKQRKRIDALVAKAKNEIAEKQKQAKSQQTINKRLSEMRSQKPPVAYDRQSSRGYVA